VTRPARILVVSWGWHSHLRPMLPLARAFAAAGHEVTVAVPASLAGQARSAGLPVSVVGRDIDAAAMFHRFVIGRPAPVVQGPPGPPRALRVFQRAAEAMVDDLVVAGTGTDLVVYEPTALAGPVAAAALGVPAVRHLYGPDLLRPAHAVLTDMLAPMAARFGVDTPPDPFGAVTVDPCPDALTDGADHPRMPERHGDATHADTRRESILVTWGATMAMLDPALNLGSRYARALAEIGPVVLAVPPPVVGDEPLPDGVRPVPNTDLPRLAASAALVVSHGGAATTLTALAAGTPVVSVGQLPDHLAIARRVAGAGAGIALAAPDADDDAVRAAVGEVLADGRYSSAARAIAAANAARPAPADLVAPLLDLIGATSARTHTGG